MAFISYFLFYLDPRLRCFDWPLDPNCLFIDFIKNTKLGSKGYTFKTLQFNLWISVLNKSIDIL